MNSLYRLMKILDLFEDRGAVVTVDHMSAELGYTRSTLYRYLKVLSDAGFVSTWNGGGYSLGPRIVELQARLHAVDPFLSAGRDNIAALARAQRGFALVCRRHKDRVLSIYSEAGPVALPVHFTTGRSSHLTHHAPGRVVLAGLPTVQVRRLHKTFSDKFADMRAVDSFDTLRAKLKHIRERGYDVDRDIDGEGIALISVAVCDEQANAIGSLSLGIDGNRMNEQRMAGIARKLTEVGQGITARLSA